MNLMEEIEVRRQKLNNIIKECNFNILDERVIKASEALDELICKFQNFEINN